MVIDCTATSGDGLKSASFNLSLYTNKLPILPASCIVLVQEVSHGNGFRI